MSGFFHGKGAVLTGPTNVLSAAAARRLAHEGALVVFAGQDVRENLFVRELMAQFRESVRTVEGELSDSEQATGVFEAAERVAGRMDLVVHTLGTPAWRERQDALVPGKIAAPMQNALTLTLGALRYMAGRMDAQILHLVPAQEIGAVEVERKTLRQLEEAWGLFRPGSVTLGALYFDRELNSSGVSGRGTDRILEQFTDRLMEEDSWAERVAIEQEIGDLVVRICREQLNDRAGAVRSFRAAPCGSGSLVSLAA